MSKFKPSKYQQAFFDWIEKGTGSAIVEAVAGSGKTTSILEALKLIDPDKMVLFLAFNKSIAEELKDRAPNFVSCMTMNALGHRAVMKKFGKVKLDPNKTYQVIDHMVDEGMMSADDKKIHGYIVKKLVDLAKSVGMVPAVNDDSMKDMIGLVEDTEENWNQIIEHYDVQIGGDDSSGEEAESVKTTCIDFARLALKLSIEWTEVIDFNDQLFFPVVYDLAVPKFDWVFVDEAQDISAIQRVLLMKATGKKGRLVAVGDPAQAIYGFRGADSDSLKNIARAFNCVTLPLSISYRCPKNVVKEAQRFVSHILPSDTAADGIVQDLGVAKPEMFQVNDMVICRNTGPVIQLAYSLISRKTPAKVMGRDIGEGLVSLVRKLKAKSINHLEIKLQAWYERETDKLRKNDPEANCSKIEDKYECLMTFIECAGADSIEGLIKSIQTMFGEDNGGVVTLSTIHKAKGLEANRVYILDAWRMPSSYAKKPHQLEQENNLFYVAVTRSKSELYYVNTPKKKEA